MNINPKAGFSLGQGLACSPITHHRAFEPPGGATFKRLGLEEAGQSRIVRTGRQAPGWRPLQSTSENK